MALGRFRDDPEEMTAAEREVVAAQYPEGALVAGMGVGMVAALAAAPALVPVAPIGGGVAGFAAGRWFRRRRIRQLEASRPEEAPARVPE